MVMWTELAPLAVDRRLYVPSTQVHTPASVRLVVFLEDGALPATTTFTEAWKRDDVRVVFVDSIASDAQWRNLASLAASKRRRLIGWLHRTGDILQYLVVERGRVVNGSLAELNAAGQPRYVELNVDHGNAPFRVFADREAASMGGLASLSMSGELVTVDGGGDQTVVLDLSPSNAGALEFGVTANAAVLRALQIDCRYFVKGEANPITGQSVDAVRYPLFALAGATRVGLRAALDLRSDGDHPTTAPAVELRFTEASALATHLFDVDGNRVSVTPSATGRLVAVPSPSGISGDTLTGEDLYFTPVGTFDVVASKRILTGIAGTELVDVEGPATITFELGDAFIETSPWDDAGDAPNATRVRAMVTAHDGGGAMPIRSPTPIAAHDGRAASMAIARRATVSAHSSSARHALSGRAKTAWMKFGGGTNVTYASQSQRAPLFKGERALPSAKSDPEASLLRDRSVSDVTTSDGLEPSFTTFASALLPHAHVPVADLTGGAALPVAPLGGIESTSTRDPWILAANRIAPARLDVASRARPATFPLTSATTPQGFVASLENGRFREVQLATGERLDKANSRSLPVSFRLELDPKTELAAELLQADVLAAISRWENGVIPHGTLAAEQWGFDVNVAKHDATAFDAGAGVVILKFHSGRLIDVIDDPRTFRTSHNADPAAAQARVQELVAPARNPPTDPFWKPLHALLHDRTWTGVVVFNPRITTVPPELSGLIATMPDTLRLKYLAVPLNRVNGALKQHNGAVSGLLDYQDPAHPSKSPFDFKVTKLRVAFADNTVAQFECSVEVKADELFYARAQAKGKPGNIVTLEGHYEAHGPSGGPTYTFETKEKEPTTFDIQKSVLKSVVLARMKFVTEASTSLAGGGTVVRSRLSIRGSLEFGTVAQPGVRLADIFSFDRLAFDDLAIMMTTVTRPNTDAETSFEFRADGIVLDVSAGPRANSLARNLPIKLKGLLARLSRPSVPEDIWSPRGFHPIPSSAFATPDFALVFTFDLGSLGGLVESARGIQIDVALGWAGSTPSIALKLPDIKGGEFAFGIEGILRVLARDFRFEQTDKSTFLRLCGAQLELLGKRYPSSNAAIGGLIIADADHPEPAWIVTAELADGPEDARNFLAVGQHLTFDPGQKNVKDVVADLAKLFRPFGFGDEAKKLPPAADDVLAGPASGHLRYAANNKWLIALRFVVKSAINGQVHLVLADPSFYGIRVEFPPVTFDLEYRRVADGVGMFYVEAPLPFSSFTAGAMQISVPNIGVSIFTDGGFRLDLGFPRDMNFARSFHVEMTPFAGAGGFYFARLATAGSDLLPAAGYKTIIQAGIGFRMGYGKTLNVGPFRASASISVYAMLEGALGYRDARLYNPDIGVRGRLGVMASLSCHLDLVLTALDFSLDIWAGVEIVLRIIEGKLQPVDVAFEVGVRVHIRWVIARFKIFGRRIEIAVTLHFERTIRVETRIGGGGNAARLLLHEPERIRALAFASVDAWRGSAKDPNTTSKPLALTLHFAPEVAIGQTGAVLLVAQLAITRSPLKAEGGSAPANSNASFDALLTLVIRWAARADRLLHPPNDPGAPFRYTKEQAQAWSKRIGALHSPDMAGLSFDAIGEFLAANFSITLTELPTTAVPVALFPMFPTLAVTVEGKPASTFDRSQYTKQDEAKLEELFRPSGDEERLAIAGAQPDDAVPLTGLLMRDYFRGLAKMAVEDLAEVATDTPATLEVLIERLRDRTKRPQGCRLPDEDAFALIGAAASGHAVNGLHIPPPDAPASGDPHGPAVYERTGQMVVLFDTPSSAKPIAVRLHSAGASGALPGPVDVVERIEDGANLAAVRQLARLMADTTTAPALGTDPVRIARMDRTRRRTFSLGAANAIPKQDQIAFALPPDLIELLARRETSGRGPMQLRVVSAVADAGDRSRAEPIPVAGCAWLLRVDFEIRKPTTSGGAVRVFEVTGADDVARRQMQRYLENAPPGSAGKASLFTSVVSGKTTNLDPIPTDGRRARLVMTNLSRRANPQQAHLLGLDTNLLEMPVSAGLDEPTAFVRLLWSASIVRERGFTIALPVSADDIAWNDGDRATLTLLVEMAGADSGIMPTYANGVRIPAAVFSPPADAVAVNGEKPSVGCSLAFVGPATDDDGVLRTSLAKPGHLTLELLRPNPDRERLGIPELGIRGGLTHSELVEQLRAKGIDPDSTDGERYLLAARDPQIHLQLGYRLLALRVDGDKPAVASYRRPLSPREIDDSAAADGGAIPNPLPAGIRDHDWLYRTSLDLDALSGGKGPYAFVGKDLGIAFSWRDGFGNEPSGPGWSWKQTTLHVRYQDRIVPVSSWPRLSAEWRPGAKAGDPLHVTISYSLKEAGGVPTTSQPSEDEELIWRTILAQVQDTRMTIRIVVPLCGEDYVLERAQREALIKFVRARAEGLSSDPTVTFGVPMKSLAKGKSRYAMTVAIRFERSNDDIDPNLAMRVPDVCSVESFVAPETSTGDTKGLRAFAETFNRAYSDFRLALGDPLGTDADSRSLWAVRATVLRPRVVKATGPQPQWARFFAPAPIQTKLVTVENARLELYKEGSETTPLRGQDVDLLFRGFLDDVEAALRPEVFALAQQGADQQVARALDDIVRAKLGIADTLQRIVAPLFERQADDGSADARAAFVEAVRADLRQAYAVDVIAQYEMKTEPVAEPELLYGDVVSTLDTSLQLSRGRLWLCPGKTSGALTLLVDRTSNNDLSGSSPGVVDARLGWRITHLAQPEDKRCGDDPARYETMRWLQLIVPEATVDLVPEKEPKPVLRVPLPVRIHPAPPTLIGHSAQPVTTPADPRAARRWTYSVEYAQDWNREGVDRVWATMRFEPYLARRTMSAMTTAPNDLERFVSVLAAWQRSSSAVLTDIAKVQSGGATLDPAVVAAYRYLSSIITEARGCLANIVTSTASMATAPSASVLAEKLLVPRPGGTVEGDKSHFLYATSGWLPTSPPTQARSRTITCRGKPTDGGIDVLTYCAASAEMSLDRNAELIPGSPSAARFIYTTESIAVGEWARPRPDPDQLFIGAVRLRRKQPDGRRASIESCLTTWLKMLVDIGGVDLNVNIAYVFNQSESPPKTLADLARCTHVPIAFAPNIVVEPGDVAQLTAALAERIDTVLPKVVEAVAAGVLVHVDAFTHPTEATVGTLDAQRSVLRLRGLWMPFTDA